MGAEVGFEGSTTLQAFHYDGADNLLRIDTGANQQALFPDPMTSQLAGNTYDTAGNLIQGGSLGSFSYDSLGMVKQATGSANKKHQYVLTPEEERLLVFDDSDSGTKVSWTARNLGQKVLRRYRNDLTSTTGWASWSWEQDYVYRGTSLLASLKSGGLEERFHLDHLGTPRAKSWRDSANAFQTTTHKYLPFGQELTSSQDSELLEFTSHERDRSLSGNWQEDLDYMHARYCSPHLGRFLSVDPGRDGWNLFAYAGNNPIGVVDPDGRVGIGVITRGRGGREGASAAVGSVPVVGDVKDVQEAVTGQDLITGEKLSGLDRGLTVLGAALPIVSGKVLRAGKKFFSKLLSKPAGKAVGAPTSGARFVAEPNGTVVDTSNTPTGSFDQPDGGRTDILQRDDHGAGLSHTHDPIVNTDPSTGATFVNGRQDPGRPVSSEDLNNIQDGTAPRSPAMRR